MRDEQDAPQQEGRPRGATLHEGLMSGAFGALGVFLLLEPALARAAGGSATSLPWLTTSEARIGCAGLATLAAAVCASRSAVLQALLAGGAAVLSVGWPAEGGVELVAPGAAGTAALLAAGALAGPLRFWSLLAQVTGAAVLAGALPQALSFKVAEQAQAPTAHATLVLGARAYPDRRPSHALADRLATAARLHVSGKTEVLLLSGGPVDAELSEVEVMRDELLAHGVPAAALMLDREGLDTDQSAASTARIVGTRDPVLVVSHEWHLPRAVLALREYGVQGLPVACGEAHPLPREAWFRARESIAFWAYWGRSLVRLGLGSTQPSTADPSIPEAEAGD